MTLTLNFLLFVVTFILTLGLTPLMRKVAFKFDVLDIPSTAVKTHKCYLLKFSAHLFIHFSDHIFSKSLHSIN